MMGSVDPFIFNLNTVTFVGCALRKQGRLDQAQTVWASGLEKCRHMIEDIEVSKSQSLASVLFL